VPRLYESLYKSITGSFKQARGAKKALITLAMAITAAFLRARDTSKGLVLDATAPGKIEKVILLDGLRDLVSSRIYPNHFMELVI
jgi:long-subunit acyl-CoA synthetase (AMP-forming)